MRFVGDYFPEADQDGSNSLNLIEFFCALPKFEKILEELQNEQLEQQFQQCQKNNQQTVSIQTMW